MEFSEKIQGRISSYPADSSRRGSLAVRSRLVPEITPNWVPKKAHIFGTGGTVSAVVSGGGISPQLLLIPAGIKLIVN